ncbi:helix-hairpin-helix domain-containing protein [Candidatus Babeliales bacterium]|nr:helix-hairpin-helix domain-containing protein [Candidatus Babeliales bacterium]
MKNNKTCLGLQQIPGVGPSISKDLFDLGFNRISDLKSAKPQKMYDDLCDLRGCHIDRCVLYVFRCAVYFASTKNYDSELLKWWNWKD